MAWMGGHANIGPCGVDLRPRGMDPYEEQMYGKGAVADHEKLTTNVTKYVPFGWSVPMVEKTALNYCKDVQTAKYRTTMAPQRFVKTWGPVPGYSGPLDDAYPAVYKPKAAYSKLKRSASATGTCVLPHLKNVSA